VTEFDPAINAFQRLF